jgi:NAD(P)H-flavin reductase
MWTIIDPRGNLAVDENGPPVIMIAGGTGLAPMRSIILDLAQSPNPPLVYLFFGGRTLRDLYAADMLWILAHELPWLQPIPVVEDLTDAGPPDGWAERLGVDIGFGEDHLVEGTLADVVSSYGAFTEHQVLVCGSAAMVRSTRDRLIATGTPAEAISFDPY